MQDFITQLNNLNLDPKIYLYVARQIAKREGYKPNKLFLSDDQQHKLYYIAPDNTKVYFGATNYNDFIIYLFKAINNKILLSDAYNKRDNYRARATMTAYKTNNKYSPAYLSLLILW